MKETTTSDEDGPLLHDDSKQLRRAKASRAGYKSAATKIKTRYKAITVTFLHLMDHTHCTEIMGMVKSIEQIQIKILDKDESIEDLLTEAELAKNVMEAEEYQGTLNSFLVEMAETIEAWKSTRGTPPPPTPPGGSTTRSPHPDGSIKLPKANMPEFSGEMTAWHSFIDQFDACVHNKTTLSDSEKLFYLKGACKGEAKKIIQSLQITNNNYLIARKALKDRYDNKRLIVTALMDIIFEYPQLRHENSNDLRKIHDVFRDTTQSLSNAGTNVHQWTDVLTYQLTKKLDHETRKNWEMKNTGTELPLLDELMLFIDQSAKSLDVAGKTGQRNQPNFETPKKFIPPFQQKPVQNYFNANAQHGTPPQQNTGNGCPDCGNNHGLQQCQPFKSKNQQERHQLAKNARLCYNCLKSGHGIAACPSNSVCRVCAGKHHTLLHRPKPDLPRPNIVASVSQAIQTPNVLQSVSETAENGQVSDVPSSDGKSLAQSSNSQNSLENELISNKNLISGKAVLKNHSTLLGTCTFLVKHNDGHQVKARCLLDTGSQANFITEEFFQKLKVVREKSTATVQALGATTPNHTNGRTTLNITLANGETKCVQAHIITKITGNLPNSFVPRSSFCNLFSLFPELECNRNLADVNFNIPASVDCLLGVEETNDLMLGGNIRHENITLSNTKCGWVVSGSAVSDVEEAPAWFDCSPVSVMVVAEDMPNDIAKFWELEEVQPALSARSLEETACEQHYNATTYVDADNRKVVFLPFKPKGILSNSKYTAFKHLNSLEAKLQKDQLLYDNYRTFIKEFVDLGHLELVPSDELEIAAEKSFYLPHHCVFKESTTTKLRVVFNASARTSTGSLNDFLMVGPTLQDKLFHHLISFRFHHVALTGDITKMYRQVALAKEDKDFHRLLWRESCDVPVQIYRMTRVTYGVASSSYHAIRALRDANLGAVSELARIILRDFYVDDLMSGAKTVTKAIELQTGLHQHLAGQHFEVRKWASSHPDVLKHIDTSLLEHEATFDIGNEEHTIKTLGIRWKPVGDYFFFSIGHVLPEATRAGLTKRTMLSLRDSPREIKP